MKRIYEFRVEFFDVDSMSVMWHGNYVKYMESARCSLLNELGYNYLDMKNDGFVFPVVKMDIKFIAPLMFGEHFCVEIELVKNEGFLIFKYIFLKNDKKIARAATSQACVEIANHQTCFILPETLSQKIRSFR